MPSFPRLALASILLAIATPAFAAFSDVASTHPNATAIQYLQEKGIIGGYPDGTFRPEKPVNRAEFVKILIGAQYEKLHIDTCLEDVQASYRVFPDVPVGIWYENYICLAKNLRIVGGYPDGTFGGARGISFAEAAKILTNTFIGTPATEGAVWYEEYVRSLARSKAIPETITSFDQKITRGEMAEIIWRLDANVTDQPSHAYEDFLIPTNGSQPTTASPVKILTGTLPTEDPYYATIDPEAIERGVDSVDCQPALFDPDKNKLYKNADGENTFWPDKGAYVFINNKGVDDDLHTYLSAPFTLTYYYVGCASEIDSYILEIKKDTARYALYTHVIDWKISPDQRYLYLENYVAASGGRWQLMRRIVELANKTIPTLPDVSCSEGAHWQGDKLLTHSNFDYNNPAFQASNSTNQNTTVCVWSGKAELLSSIQTNLEWGCPSLCTIPDQTGLLPKNPAILFIFHADLRSQHLTFQFQDLANAERYRLITLPYPEPTDSEAVDPYVIGGYSVELDPNTTFDSQTIRFRFHSPAEQITSPWQSFTPEK